MGERGGGEAGRQTRQDARSFRTKAGQDQYAESKTGVAITPGAHNALTTPVSPLASIMRLSDASRQRNLNASYEIAHGPSREGNEDAHLAAVAREDAKKKAAEEAAAAAAAAAETSSTATVSSTVSSCFVDGVLVETPEGERNVSTIKVGDLVRTKRGEGMVKEVHPAVAGGQRLYGFNDKAPFVTEAHPFMTQDGWKRVDELVTGDTLYRNGKGDVVVDTITIRDIPEDTPVYNFHVGGGSETYYADGYLVHNKTYPNADLVPKTTDYTKMLADMQATYDKQLAAFQATMDEATQGQADQLTALTAAMEEKKKKISAKKKKKTGRLSLLFNSELGIPKVTTLGGGG